MLDKIYILLLDNSIEGVFSSRALAQVFLEENYIGYLEDIGLTEDDVKIEEYPVR